MSSLPLISHHLFVEAASGKVRTSRKSEDSARRPVTLKGIATSLPLELLEAVQPMPSSVTRQLRTVGEA